ncbi:hypothetical protein CAEBREN_16932 [Caenorhabditis brenneri]|uniref:Uncharacterized protein n=1 Tax=Caenorhabditis brenneri TaxID=135651 RepID=G0MJU1_CAEBE|nr:hypothetical protein CAEBREN_16932 [Caenorhabditis brenneri]
MKSQELEEPQKVDVKEEEELEGLETRYDRFGRVFQIPFGRVSGVFKAVAQVVSASEEKIDGNKKNEPPKTMKIAHGETQAPKEGPKEDSDVKKPGRKDAPSDPASPKPKNTVPAPKPESDGKKGNTSPKANKIRYGGLRASKIDKKPVVNEKKKPGVKDGEETPKDATIGPNPIVKSVGEKRIESSKPNKIQFGQPRAPKSGEKVGVDKTKSTISTGGKGGNHETGTTRPPMPLKVGKEGGPSPLGPGTRKTSVPDEPSPIAPDTSFASGNIRSSSDSSPSTATAAPKKRRKGKKVQDWWSVRRLLLNVASNLTGVLLCAIIHFKWYRVLSPSKPEKAGTNDSNAPDAGKGPSENKDKDLNEPLPPLDEASARKRKEFILMYVVGFEKLRALEKKDTAEHKSDTRTGKLRKMGPIFIPREPPIPPTEDLPEHIVIEKIIYVPDDNEEWIIGSNIDEIEFDESYHIESDLLDQNVAPAPTAPLPPAAPTSTALPTPLLATTDAPEPSKETGKTTDENEKKEEKKNIN